MDENEIVLPIETFRKLVAQTGEQTPPQHTERDGLVVMRRAEFQALVDAMKPPADAAGIPPFDYLVTRSAYSGKMGKTGTRFTASFRIHVLKRNAYLKIPLLYQNMALEDLRVDGSPALAVSENGYHQVVLARPGEHTAEAVFSVRSSLDQGPQRLDLSVLPTPILLFRLELPFRGIDVDIPQAQALTAEPAGAGTVVTAVIPSGGSIGVVWRRQVPVTAKLPPKVYAEVLHLVSIEDGALRSNSDVVLNILHSGVDQVSLLVPSDLNVLGVSGDAVGAWQEKAQAGQRLITVPFTYARQGAAVFTVTTEKPLTEKGAANTFTGFRVPGAVRETGAIGVALNTSAEVKAAEAVGLERVAVQKLPPALANKSEKPLLLAYRFLKHPFTLVLDVERHEKITVPMASAVSANAVTLFTEDGKVVHRVIYRIRNSEKQFLEIRVPKDADVWSVFVGNEPVESSLGSDGRLLVPLIRSRTAGSRLETFPVEIIYCLSGSSFPWIGWRHAALSPADVMVSQIVWSVYVPNDYAYIYFKSTMEKEEMIRGVNVFGRKSRVVRAVQAPMPEMSGQEPAKLEEQVRDFYKGKEAKSRFRNVPMEAEQVARQMQAEMDFGSKLDEIAQAPSQAVGAGGAGVMPVQIAIPTTGQVYRFARTIVKPEDPLTVGAFFVRQGLVSLVLWIVILAVLWLLVRNRKRLRPLRDWLVRQWSAVKPVLVKAESSAPALWQSKVVLILLVLLTLVSWFLSKGFFLLVLFLLWVVAVVQIAAFFRNRRSRGKNGAGRRGGKSRAPKA
jgi:hypothetical protein